MHALCAHAAAARRSLRAARPSQPCIARRPLNPTRRPLSRALFAASSCSGSPWTPLAAHFEPRALRGLALLRVPLDATRRSDRAARLLQHRAARCCNCSTKLLGAPSTPRAAPFEPRAVGALASKPDAPPFEPRVVCRLELLGVPLDATRRSLRAARPSQPRTATRPLGRHAPLRVTPFVRPAPLTSSCATFAASSCSATPWTPRAAQFEPRAICSLAPRRA